MKPRELTLRGLILGSLLTLVFTAANVYLGLRVGLTFASSIPAAVISMAVLAKVRDSSILENNIVQTIGSAGESLAGMVHHKVHDNAWTGLPLDPAADPMPRELHRPSTAATLNLATCTTPSGTACQDPELRPDNAPICPRTTSDGRFTFVTLRGGGMFVVDHNTTPMRIVAEYDRAHVDDNGCGEMEARGKMYVNSGAGRTVPPVEGDEPYGHDVYAVELDRLRTTPNTTPNRPRAKLVYTRDGELVDIEGNPRSPISQGTLCPRGAASRQLVQQPNHRPRHHSWRLDLGQVADPVEHQQPAVRDEPGGTRRHPHVDHPVLPAADHQRGSRHRPGEPPLVDPSPFDPDRFTPERAAQRPKCAYFPFLGGPHQCIGHEFAMLEMRLLVAMILQRFDVELVPGDRARELHLHRGEADPRGGDGYPHSLDLGGVRTYPQDPGWLGEPAFARLIGPLLIRFLPVEEGSTVVHTVSLAFSFGIITFLHIVVGELAPKSLAIQKAEATSMAVALPKRAFYYHFYPGLPEPV
jgi:hypothetical protein